MRKEFKRLGYGPKNQSCYFLCSMITVLAVIVFLAGGGTDDKDVLRQTFQIEAVYYDSGQVEISYFDKSDKTNSVVMEILGMDDDFSKNIFRLGVY